MPKEIIEVSAQEVKQVLQQLIEMDSNLSTAFVVYLRKLAAQSAEDTLIHIESTLFLPTKSDVGIASENSEKLKSALSGKQLIMANLTDTRLKNALQYALLPNGNMIWKSKFPIPDDVVLERNEHGFLISIDALFVYNNLDMIILQGRNLGEKTKQPLLKHLQIIAEYED